MIITLKRNAMGLERWLKGLNILSYTVGDLDLFSEITWFPEDYQILRNKHCISFLLLFQSFGKH